MQILWFNRSRFWGCSCLCFTHILTPAPSLSDQRWPLASDPLRLPGSGSKLAPHSGRLQPARHRARHTLPPRGRTRLLLVGPKEMMMWPGDQMDPCGYQNWTPPPIFSPKTCLDCRKEAHMQREPTALLSLWKTTMTLIFSDLLVDTRPERPIWKEFRWHPVIPWTMLYYIFLSVWNLILQRTETTFLRHLQKHWTRRSEHAIISILLLE